MSNASSDSGSSNPDLIFYIGRNADVRTRLVLTKLPVTPRTLIVLSQGSASEFRARHRLYLSPSHSDNVIPLFGPSHPRITTMAEGPPPLLSAVQCDHVFFENLSTRPANAAKSLAIAASLGRLAVDRCATIMAGIFAADDSEALTLEKSLADVGVPLDRLVSCWLNGADNSPIRYVRLRASALEGLANPDILSHFDREGRVLKFVSFSSRKGSRP